MSAVHPLRLLDRVNPVSRLVAALVLTVPLLLTIDWLSASVAVIVQLALFLAAGISAREILHRSLPLLVAAPITGLSLLLYGRPSGQERWSFWLAHVTDGSIELAIAVTIRVFAIGLPAVLLFLRVDPSDLADGLAQVIRLPARFVLGALAGTRLIGLFLDDWRSMALSRRARGLGDAGALRRFATMSFALLVLAIRRGSKLATAMEARGFGGPVQRTWARESRLGGADVVLLAIALVVVATAVASAVLAGTWRFLLG